MDWRRNEEMEEAIAKIVLYYGGNILPKYVLSRLKYQFDSRKSNLTKLIAKKRSEVIKDELGTGDAYWIGKLHLMSTT